MSFSIIAAIGKNRELGKKGGLVFNIPGDLKFFKQTTMGFPVVMGRTTFLSLPKLLPGRKHFVLSPDEEPTFPKDAEEAGAVGLEVVKRLLGAIVLEEVTVTQEGR